MKSYPHLYEITKFQLIISYNFYHLNNTKIKKPCILGRRHDGSSEFLRHFFSDSRIEDVQRIIQEKITIIL